MFRHENVYIDIFIHITWHGILKNRLRGSKPSAFTWITSLLRYNRTTDWKYIYMHIYLRSKINVILARRNIVVVLRRKPDAMTMLPNVERRHSC